MYIWKVENAHVIVMVYDSRRDTLKSKSLIIHLYRRYVVCCLTNPSRWSAMFSSELPGRMSFFSRPPWMWRAWLTPAIATTRARRVTTAAASMVIRQERSDKEEKLKGGWQLVIFTGEGLVLVSVRCPLCAGVLANFSGGNILTGSLYTPLGHWLETTQESLRKMQLHKREQGTGWRKKRILIWDLTRSI